ncbi:YafY family protein [Pseudoruegeria sp. HB172150]|uniref:helix-turn-helix transcriptional regulator n=1 Tax=Pseudoruegeria sp. HB172150 TaxID=2721164 RepID=UPI001552F2E0|nr:YafY family protein [Pseudoruegeria sp. HB172150]
MRRTDRLYTLIQTLRDGRIHKAVDLAKRVGVSERTIWRDMETLMSSGVPVRGERGLGYKMTNPVTLPPLNLSLAELEALHLGLAAVAAGGDEELRTAAQTLSNKIDAVLPEDRATAPKNWGFAVYPFADAAQGFRHMPRIRAAIRARQKLAIDYDDPAGDFGRRVIRPLKLDYWGRVWTVTCWCETGADFAVLRIDRIETLDVMPALFVEEQGKTLMDLRAREVRPSNFSGQS